MEPIWENIFRKDRKEKTIESALRANILFQDLNARELNLVQQIVNVRAYSPGERIFQQGEIGVGMYIVLRGEVEIATEKLAAGEKTPERNVVTRLKDGDFFGELALVEEAGRRGATATATEETTLIGFFKPDLMEIVSRNSTAGAKILLRLSQVLGSRLTETTALIRQLRQNSSSKP